MRCSKARKQLSPYLDDELGARDSTLLDAHLAQCVQCAEELAGMRRLHDLFTQAGRYSAPAAFRAKIMEKATDRPAKVYTLFPLFIRFAEASVFVLAITAGIMSGGMLINAVAPYHKGEQVLASFSLETFAALPPDSLGRAYLAMTEERR